MPNEWACLKGLYLWKVYKEFRVWTIYRWMRKGLHANNSGYNRPLKHFLDSIQEGQPLCTRGEPLWLFWQMQPFCLRACVQDLDYFCRVRWVHLLHESGSLICGTIPLFRTWWRLCVTVLRYYLFIYLKIHDRRTRRPLISLLSDTENTAAQWNTKKRKNYINVKKTIWKLNGQLKL